MGEQLLRQKYIQPVRLSVRTAKKVFYRKDNFQKIRAYLYFVPDFGA